MFYKFIFLIIFLFFSACEKKYTEIEFNTKFEHYSNKGFALIYEDNLLKNIINKELDRKGQIFFVTPRIKEIQDLEKKLKKNFSSINYAMLEIPMISYLYYFGKIFPFSIVKLSSNIATLSINSFLEL